MIQIKKSTFKTIFIFSSIALSFAASAKCPNSASTINGSPYFKGENLIAECTTVLQMKGPHGQPDLCIYSGTDTDLGVPFFASYSSNPQDEWGTGIEGTYENDKSQNDSLSILPHQMVGTQIGLRECGFGTCGVGLRDILTYNKTTQQLIYERDVKHLFWWVTKEKDVFGCKNVTPSNH